MNEGTIKKRTNELKERSARLEETLNTMGDLEKASTICLLLEKLMKMVLFQRVWR